MYDNDGSGSPQRPVTPDFNMDEANRMLEEYKGGHSSFPVAQGIVDKFVSEYKDSHKGVMLSDRDPTAAATAAELEKQNEQLRQDVGYLKELLKLQGKVTGGTVFKKSSVEAAATYLMKYAGAKGSKQELAGMLNDFYRFIATDKELTWESVLEQAHPIAKWLQNHVEMKPQLTDYARDVLKEIRSRKVSLDEQQMKEVEYQYGSYDAFRKGDGVD